MKGLSCVVLLAALASGTAAGQRFTSGVELVQVDALVTDRRQPVRGLTAADFELRDNGVVQDIRQLEVERLPLAIFMALDTSGSVAGDRLMRIKGAAGSVVDRLRPGDRAAVVTFSHVIRRRAPLTDDRAELRRAIQSLDAFGRTSLRDGAYAGIAMRAADPARALLLLFTDGVDTGSFLSTDLVLKAARRSDLVAYAVAARDDSGAPTDQRFLEALTGETGGRVLVADDSSGIEAAFQRVLDEFSQRYVLTYAPTGVAAGGWHEVSVKLKSRRGIVNARRGYYGRP